MWLEVNMTAYLSLRRKKKDGEDLKKITRTGSQGGPQVPPSRKESNFANDRILSWYNVHIT
jgi:hypothetical protein